MTISDQLREVIRASGKTALAVAEECGTSQPVVSRFLRGGGIGSATADKIAAHFGLSLAPAPATKPAKKKPTAKKAGRPARPARKK